MAVDESQVTAVLTAKFYKEACIDATLGVE
jgi:hypothetical protein